MSWRLVLGGLLSVCLLPVPVLADDAPAAEDLSPREAMARAAELNQKLAGLFQQKKYEEAAELCRQGAALPLPDAVRSNFYYNHACCLARLDKPEEALTQLEAAVKHGYEDLSHMQEDPDLESLRKTDRWKALVKTLSAGMPPTYRKTDDGTVITGRAGGGLSYRILQGPKATKETPHRLVVWLHPSGGLGNDAAERLAPTLHKNDLSLMVFESKNAAGWTGDDMKRLMVTLKVMKDVQGVNPERPLLLGYSAGGQAALTLWADDPQAFGGLIVDAAYPLDMAAYARRQVKLMALGKDQPVDKTPIFVLVGDADGGSQLWKKAQTEWAQRDVPLVVHYVPKGRHQWLFGKQQVALLDSWLAEVMAGKLPKAEAPQESDDKPAAPEARADSDYKGEFTLGDPFAKPEGGWPATPKTGRIDKVALDGMKGHSWADNAWFHLAVPKDYTPEKAWPVMVVLHGGPNGKPDQVVSFYRGGLSERGVISIYPKALAEQVLDWNYPHTGAYLLKILEQVGRTYRLDPKRIYLTGVSMGGGGSWVQGALLGDVWAAIGPVSGWYGASYSPDAKLLKDVPVYCMHGEKDDAVPALLSKRALEAMKGIGRKPGVFDGDLPAADDLKDLDCVFRQIPKAGHNCFEPWKTRGAGELGLQLSWMLSRQKDKDADVSAALKKVIAHGKPFGWTAEGSPIGRYSD